MLTPNLLSPALLTPFPQKISIGSVPYLNALPLISFLPVKIELAIPSALVPLYQSQTLDAALLPIYPMLQYPAPLLADHICISSHGPVFSVFLAHQCPLHHLKRVHLDPASCTSNALFQCLCAEFLHILPEISTAPPGPEDARILIGDPAIQFRMSHAQDWNFLDLGQSWYEHTGLPFVYAAWALQEGHYTLQIADFLRAAQQLGIAHLDELVAKTTYPDFAKIYLSQNICYHLNEAAKQGIFLFSELLYKHGLSPILSKPLFI